MSQRTLNPLKTKKKTLTHDLTHDRFCRESVSQNLRQTLTHRLTGFRPLSQVVSQA
jgi:hypothetical protein